MVQSFYCLLASNFDAKELPAKQFSCLFFINEYLSCWYLHVPASYNQYQSCLLAVFWMQIQDLKMETFSIGPSSEFIVRPKYNRQLLLAVDNFYTPFTKVIHRVLKWRPQLLPEVWITDYWRENIKCRWTKQILYPSPQFVCITSL